MKTRYSHDISTICRQYDEFGYAFLEKVLDDHAVAAIQYGVEWAMAQPPERFLWIRQRNYEWHEQHPVFAELLEHPLVVDIARELLGEDFHVIAAQCSRNTRDEPYFPSAMKLHQDRCFFEDRAVPSNIPNHRWGFTAMWYVCDIDSAMGPTAFIPRSHIHDPVNLPSAPMSCPGPAGSLLIFSHRIWHQGQLNQREPARDLISNAYARPEIEKVQLSAPDDDGGYVPCQPLLRQSGPVLQQLLKARPGLTAAIGD